MSDCPICGADLQPSATYVWHYPDEDCRAIRQPSDDYDESITPGGEAR